MKTKTVKIALEGFGSYLGMEKGCFIVKNREGQTEKYPLFENLIDEIKIKSGNSVSSGALASLGFWGIDCLFLTQKGRPVAMLRSLDDDSHVRTRVSQYEALGNEKTVYIAKQFILAKLEGQKQLLKKYGLRNYDFSVVEKVKNLEVENTAKLRSKLMSIEGHFSERYFNQIFSLIPHSLRPNSRKT
jgi:CRISPR-associated endonuclease Cas1